MCLPCWSPSIKIFPKTQTAEITFKSCFWRFLIGNTRAQITFKTPNIQDLLYHDISPEDLSLKNHLHQRRCSKNLSLSFD
ncbi:hypothetical protein IMY05_010G0075600 [Salix suchowensis]|nr:hypothetical protein IMY05_010G0075600 [Salix suchowensis]